MALNTPELKERKEQGWIDGWKEEEGYIERGCVRENKRTRGVSGKGLDFPREALSESERETDENT